jgi:hypothetical protein
MRYRLAAIEDQILASLKANEAFQHVLVDTLAGQINPQMFADPAYMQGFLKLLPFALVAYNGRVGEKSKRDSSGKTYEHTLTFRIFTGAQSLRDTKEATHSCYDLLAAEFDALAGKVIKSVPQRLPTYTELQGVAITDEQFVAMSPFYETGGEDETLVVSLPGIVVYQSDWSVRVIA